MNYKLKRKIERRSRNENCITTIPRLHSQTDPECKRNKTILSYTGTSHWQGIFHGGLDKNNAHNKFQYYIYQGGREMTRAEEAALKAYPIHFTNMYMPDGLIVKIDINTEPRKLYQKAYEQAEKDLALTADDVWCIFNLVRDLQTKYSATEGCLQEVADIFNEQKEK